MKKTILALMLAAVSGAAMAEWVDLGESDRSTAYFDPATIRRSGDKVKMWRLIDLKSPDRAGGGQPYLSVKAQDEFDCKDERFRTLYIQFHSGKMGNGTTTGTGEGDMKWTPVSPGSVGEAIWKAACSKN